MIFKIESKDSGKLLRTFLHEHGVSAALLAKLKRREGGILQNGNPVTVRAVLKEGDEVRLALEDKERPVHVVPRDLPIDVLLKSDDFAVLNKPADMPTHPSHGHYEDTLANALSFHFARDGVPFCPRFVNRLDRNTSGAVLVAMHPISAAALSRAMAGGEVQKTYLALVHGEVLEPRELCTGIRRRTESIIFREVCSPLEGDLAQTEIQPLAVANGMTLVRLVPHTGRTHQLRVHMAHLGHPLLGDDLYGYADGHARHMLHAATLRFPTSEGEVLVRAPLAADMRALIESMGKEALRIAEAETQ